MNYSINVIKLGTCDRIKITYREAAQIYLSEWRKDTQQASGFLAKVLAIYGIVMKIWK